MKSIWLQNKNHEHASVQAWVRQREKFSLTAYIEHHMMMMERDLCLFLYLIKILVLHYILRYSLLKKTRKCCLKTAMKALIFPEELRVSLKAGQWRVWKSSEMRETRIICESCETPLGNWWDGRGQGEISVISIDSVAILGRLYLLYYPELS